jgi:hypothetical protein
MWSAVVSPQYVEKDASLRRLFYWLFLKDFCLRILTVVFTPQARIEPAGRNASLLGFACGVSHFPLLPQDIE